MSPHSDMLYTFTGIRSSSVRYALRSMWDKRIALETHAVEHLTRHPPESLAGFTMSAAAAFYLAEKEVNPQINSPVDAFYYISTCLTVGYADVFPATQTGRLIASMAMIIGPALANNLLDPPGREKPSTARSQEAIIERLDGILAALKG